MSEPSPKSADTIESFHAHVYFRDADERTHALALRSFIGEQFSVQLGRVHEVPVGPHTAAMYQIAFGVATFQQLVPWLMLNRRDLSVLVHPNTGRARDDHLVHALWLGEPLAVRGDVLSNGPDER